MTLGTGQLLTGEVGVGCNEFGFGTVSNFAPPPIYVTFFHDSPNRCNSFPWSRSYPPTHNIIDQSITPLVLNHFIKSSANVELYEQWKT